ncbi:MAG: putative membrane protein [Nitriliruptoraceae bacterium]|jgi:uncharacterized membrane protein
MDVDPPDGTSSLVAIRLEDPLLAQEGLLAAMRLVKKGQMSLEDAAIILKDDAGRLHIHETRDMRPAQGARGGSWVGMLAGLFIGGPALFVGAVVGAAAGGIFAKLRDIGIQDEQMQQLAEALGDGDAALLLLVEDVHLFHAMAELRRFAGQLIHSTCDEQTNERVRESLANSPGLMA